MTQMEELTQTQIILLTLLVSFITSIATGIITTSLLAEAPAGVTQTINRVVEHTIETVAPSATSTIQTIVTTPGTKEVTVINENDQVVSAIDKISKGVVRIKGPSIDGTGNFYSLGAVITSDGYIVSDFSNPSTKDSYSVILADGTIVTAHFINIGNPNNLGVFKIDAENTRKTFDTVAISPNEPKLGQIIIVIEGKDKNSIALGRVLGLQTGFEKDEKGNDISVAYKVNTDITSNGELPGSILINLAGELLGIKTSNNDLSLTPGTYITAVPINRIIAKAKQ